MTKSNMGIRIAVAQFLSVFALVVNADMYLQNPRYVYSYDLLYSSNIVKLALL